MTIFNSDGLPELLCPAGSPEALDAAIEGGADAVYLGGASFNARMNAKNFGGDALRSAVLRAHTYGVKVYMTLNTLVTDRELPAYLEAAKEAQAAGVDALIVADLGGASVLRRVLPDFELHASTQMSGHNVSMAKELEQLGFTRMVIARETPFASLEESVSRSPLETELFIHGALCVSHSGQCLFSSLVGGRSGNRGECAQPCRLPYSCAECAHKKGNSYPLSLKDLSLARHIPEIIRMGVASLKIEGRMKAPEYVRDTARIYRRLLDERRAATPEEMRELSDIFSRGGFTDGYQVGRISEKMLGIRSEADKASSRESVPFTGLTRRIPLHATLLWRSDAPARLTLSDGTHTVTVEGDTPQAALTAPMSEKALAKSLSKCGGTAYEIAAFSMDAEEGLMLPISRLNDLRRRAIETMTAARTSLLARRVLPYTPICSSAKTAPLKEARFYTPSQITPSARAYFDRIYLPLERYEPVADGVILPPVIFDAELPRAKALLQGAVASGARYALIGNLGHLSLAKEHGLIPVGDFRLNATNSESVARLEEMGLEHILLSPELSLPQMRDIKGATGAIVYGRIPLMTLEKCIIRDAVGCDACTERGITLTDRKGVSFPVLREWEHRNVIYNSLPTAMPDRSDALTRAQIACRHFLFSTESREEVDRILAAYERGGVLPHPARRM